MKVEKWLQFIQKLMKSVHLWECRKEDSVVKLLSHVRLLQTPWTAAYQAPLSMGVSRQEYWSGVPLPSPPDGTSGKKTRLPTQETVMWFDSWVWILIPA